MEDKGYISTANRKRERVLKAIIAETNGISITKQGLAHYYNNQYKKVLLDDAKKKYLF